MNPFLILYLNHVSYLGGAEIALLDLLRGLNTDRYEPAACVPEGPLAEELHGLGIRVVSISPLPGLNRYTLAKCACLAPRLIARVKHEKPDVIHANTNWTSFYAGILSHALNIPTAAQIRDMEPPGRMGSVLWRQNSRLLAISGAVKHYLINEGVPAHQIALIHDGVDLAQYPPDMASNAVDFGTRASCPHREGGQVVIAIIGQIGQRKGHLYLLQAVSELVNTYPFLHLWIVGKEPAHSREQYTEQIQHTIAGQQLEPFVRVLGFRADIPDILRQIDMLILPSLQEPFGKIVVEAMAMGKPVIASQVGGVPEIVVDGETGILVPPRNVEAIRQAVEQLLIHPEKRRQMGQAGRKRVERHFRIEQTVSKTEQIYEQLLFQHTP